MSRVHLPINFASQSVPLVMEQVSFERGIVALLAAEAYPAAGMLAFADLCPGRHYRLGGATDGMCKASSDGVVRTSVTIPRAALLTLAPVV